MKTPNDIQNDKLGDQAPRLKDLIIVIAVVAILTFLSWLTYYKFGWFH